MLFPCRLVGVHCQQWDHCSTNINALRQNKESICSGRFFNDDEEPFPATESNGLPPPLSFSDPWESDVFVAAAAVDVLELVEDLGFVVKLPVAEAIDVGIELMEDDAVVLVVVPVAEPDADAAAVEAGVPAGLVSEVAVLLVVAPVASPVAADGAAVGVAVEAAAPPLLSPHRKETTSPTKRFPINVFPSACSP